MIVVDDAGIPWYGDVLAHLACDAGDDIETLHRFAAKIGLERSRFQDGLRIPSYYVTSAVRDSAIEAGAVPLGRTEYIKRTTREKE